MGRQSMTTQADRPKARLSFHEGTLVLEGWVSKAVEKVFGTNIWSFDGRSNNWRCEASRYRQIKQLLDQKAVGTIDEVPRWQTVNWAHNRLPLMRPEQQAAIDAWMPEQRGIIVMPTGTGKTEVALSIMNQLRCSTLVVAPIRDLMYQWQRRILKGLDYDSGVIGDSLFNARAVSVTTYDSACIHMPRLGNQFKLIIFDECHHLPGPIRRDAARMSAAPFKLGLTATLERSDGKHADLTHWIGPVVHRLELANVRGQSLADYEIFRVPVHLNSVEQTRYDELSSLIQAYCYKRLTDDPEFTWESLSAEYGADPDARRVLQDRAEEKLRILEDLFRLHHGSPVLVFTGSNAMARAVSRRFLIPCLLNHCGKAERLDYLDGLRNGVYPAIVANQVLDEGVDVPEVKVAIVLGGKSSTKQAKQRLGRILRRSGDEKAVLYEVVAQNTNETKRSRRRRNSDAYSGTRHRRL
jgi:superfamily II DNA or RNA helicase